jgi:lipoteichoic acid synthase
VFLVAGAVACRRNRERIPEWAWVVLELVPVLATALACGLGARVVHTLINVRLRGETTLLVDSGAQLLAILPALFWGRARAVAAGVWLTMLGVLMLGDVWYYRFFGALPSILAFGSGGQIWEIRDSAVEVLRWKDTTLLVPIALGLVLATLWPSRKVLPHGHQALASGLLVWALWLGARPIVDNVQAWMGTRFSWKVFSAGALVRSQGLWGAHFRETARAGRDIMISDHLTPERSREVTRYHQTLDRRHSPHFGAAAGANVLLVQVEAMQQWVLNANVQGEPVMPFLSALAQRSVYYANVWDLTGEQPTADCEYMVLNSQHPLQRGAVAFRRASNDFVTIGTELGDAGYTTFSSHGYSKTMWNRSVLHPKYGFQSSAFADDLGKNPKLGWGLADTAFFERATPKLKEFASPWFGFLVTLTSHHPYTYIPREMQKLKLSKLGASLEGYVHSMRYVDESLQTLFAQLERDGLLTNTLVVIYGDHDSKLKFGKPIQDAATRQLGLTPEIASTLGLRGFATKKIPVIFVPPRLDKPEVVTALGGQVDIGPTVLDWLGKEAPNSFIGRALFNDSASTACETCDVVARYDGTALNDDVLWEAAHNTCYERKTGKKTASKRCTRVKNLGEQELAMSWDVTLHNLARTLRTAPALGATGAGGLGQQR